MGIWVLLNKEAYCNNLTFEVIEVHYHRMLIHYRERFQILCLFIIAYRVAVLVLSELTNICYTIYLNLMKRVLNFANYN